MYAKAGTPTPDLKDRTVDEEALPVRLISDFTRMVVGLVPSLVLASLTTVRENVYRVLERFDAEARSGLSCASSMSSLSHRNPSNTWSSRLGVSCMESWTTLSSRRGRRLALRWSIGSPRESEGGPYTFGDREVSLSDTKSIFNKGLKVEHGGLGGKLF